MSSAKSLLRLSLPCVLSALQVAPAWSRQISASAVDETSESTDLAPSVVEAPPLEDKPLAEFQKRLLELAFDSVSAMPLYPHVKNRSRAQQEVFADCLVLDQAVRASTYAKQIEEIWRRGACYADLAYYCAEHGNVQQAERYLKEAADIARGVNDENSQQWRKDRVLAGIARTYHRLGKLESAAEFEIGLGAPAAFDVLAAKSKLAPSVDFDTQMGALEVMIADGGFDNVLGALKTYTQLFDRFYDDKTLCSRVEGKIKTSWGNLPFTIRVGLVLDLGEIALARADHANALAYAAESQALMESARWTAENGIPVVVRRATLRFRAGEGDAARKDVDSALDMYDAERGQIVNIYRAGVLRPLAETLQYMGDAARARTLYKRAIEEGFVNPNSRPRADDLAATCRSMARCKAEPDEELWKRMAEIRKALTGPW